MPVSEQSRHHGDLIQMGRNLLLFLLEELDVQPPAQQAQLLADGEAQAARTKALSAEDLLRLGPRRTLETLPPDLTTLHRLAALLELGQSVHAAAGAEQIAKAVVDLLPGVVSAERAVVMLFGESPEEIEVSQGMGGTGGALPKVSRTLARRAIEERKVIVLDDVLGTRELREARSIEVEGLSSLACAPIFLPDRPLGILYVDTRAPEVHFADAQIRLLSVVAAITATALGRSSQLEKVERERRRLHTAELRHDLVGRSKTMHQVHEFLAKAAPTDATVLLRGESGTGKELVARALHGNSPRADRPFVAINCAALSETLLESDLFGHEKGAFTGATARKLGKIEVADTGSVFLDEVGDLPLSLQAKLLRVLQERELERVGSTRPIGIDVRVIAATNRDLEQAIADGLFREDLYYRLNVVSLTLPPLRARREDIPLLAQHFIAHSRVGHKGELPGMTPEALECLMAYDWPGNVRELANAIERALVLGDGTEIRPEDLPEGVVERRASSRSGSGTYQEVVTETKKRLVLEAVRDAGGNITRAARRLDIHPNYLHRLIRNLDLKDAL